MGFTRVLLETGYRQQPAMRLYESCGYVPSPSIGAQAGDPTSRRYKTRLS